MRTPFLSPTTPMPSRRDTFLGYLDFFRDTVIDKIEALPEARRRTSMLPSGWTPVELIKHLTFVELRWLEWGFEGSDVPNPWGDDRDGRWHVPPTETTATLLTQLRHQSTRTRAIVQSHDLTETGQPGPRWDGAEPATLERVLFHLVQEYARHTGHLDVVVELAGGPTGE